MQMPWHKKAVAQLIFLTALMLGQSGNVWAEEEVEPESFLSTDEPIEQVDQRTPLTTAIGFMRFAENGDYDRAAEYLDLRYLPDEMKAADGTVLAEHLYVVISRKMPIDFGALSDEPDGRDDDGLPSYRDALAKIETSRGLLTIFLQHVPGPGDSSIWKVSNASVAQVPALYEEFGYSRVVEAILQVSPEGSFLGAEYFKWIIALLSGAVGAVGWLAVAGPLSRFVTRRNVENKERVRRFLARPIPAVIFIMLGYSVLLNLGLGVKATRIAEGGTLVTFVLVWLLFSAINLSRDIYARYLKKRGRESALMLLQPITSTTKVLLIIIAAVMWLDNIGVNVTALVAGLGVGGLAVALVLQKPLEDIMGAITLYTQQPVTVGQYCTCGDVTGTVEEINLRTTRIRTIRNTVVVIPNARFATASIENVTARRRILHNQTVRLALGTSEKLLRSVLQNLREMLLTIDKVSEDATRVRLIGFGEFSIDVQIFVYVGTTDWDEFLAIAEDINLGTIAVLEKAGAKIAEPPR